MDLAARRSLEVLAIFMVGDGLITLLHPRRQARLWRAGPPGWRDLFDWLEERPGLTAGLAAAEAALGLWLARRQLGHG